MSSEIVPLQGPQKAVKMAISTLPKPCWDDVGIVLGKRANCSKVISPRDVRKMMRLTLAQMGALVAAIMSLSGNPRAPYHRSTVAHWETPARKSRMGARVIEVYKAIIKECVRAASGGRYAAQIQNTRKWRVTLRRIA